MSDESSRPTAHEILEQVLASARDELKRSSLALGISGVAAGISMGLSGLGVALLSAKFGKESLVPFLLYPLGFIVVIIARNQLFTENTLYPVALALDERRFSTVLNTLRLWIFVFIGNVIGAGIFGVLMARITTLKPEALRELAALGTQNAQHPWTHLFSAAIIGGWLIALVAWVVSASHYTSGHILMTWLITFVVGAGHFPHCIAGSAEVLTAVAAGSIPLSQYLYWLAPVTLGNILGGVFIVTLLNFGQVSAS
jgi:formate/nitrite transporter FocA (FNT family)